MIGELQMRLLGGLRLDRDGAPLTGFVSNKAPALLAYLAVTRRPHSRDALATLFWGDLPDADAKNNLRQALTNLRRVVEPNLIITRDTLEFNAETPYFLDVTAFERSLKQPIGLPPDQVLARLQAAVDLYRGEFLEGVFVRDAPEFEEWALTQRTHLRDLALQAFHALTELCLTRGEYAHVIDYAARLLALDPWREEAHRQLMLAHVRSGQPSAALAQYEVCRKVMRQEFNAEPSAETSALNERIRAALVGARGNLTEYAPPSTLIGRERERADLVQRLRDSQCRLVTLVGLGGSGKTRLALAVAQDLALSFLNGVYFVPLVAAQNVNDMAGAISEVLHYTLKGEAHTALPAYLRSKELLLVLDNFEHLIDCAGCVPLLSAIVKQAPNVKILISSRESVALQHEWLYEVKELPSADARMLFVQTAQRLAADYDLARDESHITRICRLVSGLPLGVELAAAWTRVMSCADIAAELERRSTALASPLRDAPERHRSLQAVFDYSWQLLTPVEQRILAALTVFRGGFTREAAQAVAGASTGSLLGLVNQSLVQKSPAGRFDLHELVRHYLEDKVIEIDALADRHAAYYADFLARREAWLHSERQATAFSDMRAEIDNVRRMWQRAIQYGDAAIFQRALRGLCWIYDAHGRPTEGAALLAEAAATLEPDPTQLALRGQLLARQARFLVVLSRFDQVETVCHQAEALSHEAGDLPTKAFLVRLLGYCQVVAGNLQTARDLMARCLEMSRQTDDLPGTCEALNGLAIVQNNLGEYAAARECLLEAEAHARAMQDAINRSITLSNLGSTAYYQRQFDQAGRYFQASYDIDAAQHDRRRMAVNLHNVACVQCDLQHWDSALQTQQDALALFTEGAQPEGILHARQNLARIHLGLDDLPEARRHLAEALKIAQQIGAVRDSLEISVIGAELLRRENQFDRAAQVIGRVLQHSAATAAVKEDAHSVLNRLGAHSAAIAETPPENAAITEIVALITG